MEDFISRHQQSYGLLGKNGMGGGLKESVLKCLLD